MEQKNYSSKQNQTGLGSLLGELTPAKTSGLAFTMASILPSIVAFVFLLIAAVVGLLQPGYDKTDWYLYVMYLLPQLAFCAIAFFYIKATKQNVRAIASEQKCHAKYFLIAFLLQFGLFGLSQINGWFIEWLGNFGYETTGVPVPSVEGFGFVGVLLVIAVLPAIFEETMFRGILLNGVRAFGRVGAILICGAMFSLYHQNPEQTIYQFCCGAAYSLLALKAGSILPTILAHFANNAVILIMYKWSLVVTDPTLSIVLLVLSALCLVGALAYLIFVDKQPKTDTDQTNAKKDRKEFMFGAALGVVLCLLNWVLALFQGM